LTPSPSKALLKLSMIAIVLSLPLLAKAYDYPLSPNAIREAYFLGTRATSLGPDFLAQYTHTIPTLKVGRFTSGATLETPFGQVAVHASSTLAYSAQNAVKEFYGRARERS
jgi:hypothetical protein